MGVQDVSFAAANDKEGHSLAPIQVLQQWHLTKTMSLVTWESCILAVLAHDLSLDQAPIIFELDLELILLASGKGASYLGASMKFPPVTRDLAFVIDRGVTHENFAAAFGSFNRRKNLRSFRLFDVYQGEHLADDKKSMAFSLEFQSDKKTLTDKEVEKEVQALVEWFKSELSAELR